MTLLPSSNSELSWVLSLSDLAEWTAIVSFSSAKIIIWFAQECLELSKCFGNEGVSQGDPLDPLDG